MFSDQKLFTPVSMWAQFFICSYLDDRRMLKQGGVAHKSNIVYLQFKLLPTHIRFGGQDCGEDDVREPKIGKNPNKKMCNVGRARTSQTQLRWVRKFKLAQFAYTFHIPVYRRGYINQMHLPVIKFNKCINGKQNLFAY